jgi:hypothetical protein
MTRRAMALLRTALTPVLLALLSGFPAMLAAQAQASDQPLPTDETLRELQRQTLACGRENSREPCELARNQADPLLDHPRLSGRCKDTLWIIRQQAVEAPSNTFERRQRLNRAGGDVLLLCRPQTQPVRAGQGSGKDATQNRSGFGLIPGN